MKLRVVALVCLAAWLLRPCSSVDGHANDYEHSHSHDRDHDHDREDGTGAVEGRLRDPREIGDSVSVKVRVGRKAHVPPADDDYATFRAMLDRNLEVFNQ